MRAGNRRFVALVIVQAALGFAGCQSGSGAATLSSLQDRSIEVDIAEVDDIRVQLTYVPAGGSCPTVAATVQAVFNGQAMDLVNRGGPSTCSSQFGPCSCDFVEFHLGGAFALARPDGSVDVTVSDPSETISLSASAFLMPSAVSLTPPQSDHLSANQTIFVTVTQPVPPFTLAPLELAHQNPDNLEILEGREYDAFGQLSVGFPDAPPGPAVLDAKKADGLSMPVVTSCLGAMTCYAGATNLVGAIPLVIE
jgi:hypothetical protein